MEDSILNIITKYMTAERLEDYISDDAQYQKGQDEIARLTQQVSQLGLSKEVRLTMDRLLSANNENNARYSELAYMQGFKDCAALLKEINLLKI